MKWKLIVILAVLSVAVSYSLVFVPHLTRPELFSMPYILWTGILATLVLVVLTYLGAKFFPFSDK